MTDSERSGGDEPSTVGRRDLLKGVLFGGVGGVESRREALASLVGSGGRPSGSGSPASPRIAASRGSAARTSAPIRIPTPDRIPIRDIAENTPTASGPAFSMVEVAAERGLLDVSHPTKPREDPPFSFRELVTPQAIEDDGVKDTKRRSSWRNWVHDHGTDDLAKYRTGTEQDLLDAVIWNAREQNRIRAVGSGHSHSKVAAPDLGFIELSWNASERDIEGLIDPLEQPWLKDDGELLGLDLSSDDLVRVQAGARIKHLNRALLKDAGKALINMGSFDGQTLAGAINTSTHGTGARLGSLADTVRSVELLTVMESPVQPGTPLVRKFRIEPTDGITDRESFEADVGEHGSILVQDDDIFHSAVVGYGSMGVAYAYTIEVMDRYFLHEENVTKKWDDFKGDIGALIGEPDHTRSFAEATASSNYPTGARHFQFLVNLPQVENPGLNDPRNPRCLLKSHRAPWRYASANVGTGKYDRWPREPTERAEKSFQEWVRRRQRKAVGGFHPKETPFYIPTGINSRFQSNQNNAAFEGDVPSLSTETSAGPNMSASYIALRRMVEEQPHPEVEPEAPPPAISTEIAVPADQVVEAVEEVLEEVISNDYAYNVPMGVRFVARSEHALAPEYQAEGDRDVAVAKIEVPFLVRHYKDFRRFVYYSQQDMLKHGKNALGAIEKRLLDMSRRGDIDFARPHMGKTNRHIGRQELAAFYDDFPTWQAVHETFDAFGTFDNRFTDDKGISIR